jgi:hypothetical protein
MDDFTFLKFKGKLMWPKLFHTDTKFKKKWTTDLLLDENELKRAKEENLRVKFNKKYVDQFDGYDGHYIRLDREETTAKGEKRQPPVVKDKNIRDVPPDISIGNGTDAIVRFMLKTMDEDGNVMSPAVAQKKYKGYGGLLTGVQIINLVEFERSSDPDTDFVQEEGSYSAHASSDGGFEIAKGEDPFDDEFAKNDTNILNAG